MIRGHGIETAEPDGKRWAPHEELMESVMELAIADFMAPSQRVLLCGADRVKKCNGNHRREYQRCPRKGRPGCGAVEVTKESPVSSQAKAWIMSNEVGIFSFVGICGAFRIDPCAARRELMRRKAAGERVSMKSIRFSVNRPRTTLAALREKEGRL